VIRAAIDEVPPRLARDHGFDADHYGHEHGSRTPYPPCGQISLTWSDDPVVTNYRCRNIACHSKADGDTSS
jgi:hypothetical protein